MSKLYRAIEAAENRKAAVLGEAEGPTLAVTNDTFQRLAMFNGFDISPEELEEVAIRVGYFFCHMAPTIGLRALFSSAYVDGLLTGLFLATASDSPESDLDAPGSGEEWPEGSSGTD